MVPYINHVVDAVCVTAVVGDITVGALTLAHLGPVVGRFYSVMYLNQGVRGPMAKREDAGWLKVSVDLNVAHAVL